jgi:hypothetical protein
MYCSSCGVSVAQGLSYCKNCGAKVNRVDDDSRSSELRPDLLVTSIVATFIFGLAVMTALMGVMKVILGLPVDRVLAFMSLPFLLMLILEGVFIRLLLRRTRSVQTTLESNQAREQATNELDDAHVRALPEGVSSVTEHTTRAFEPIYRDKR